MLRALSAVVKGSTETLGADSLKAVIMSYASFRYGFVEDQIGLRLIGELQL